MKDHKQSGGLGIVGVLTLIFIVLKVTGLITWSWLWVLSPLWITIALYFVLVILFLFFCAIVMAINDAIKNDE